MLIAQIALNKASKYRKRTYVLMLCYGCGSVFYYAAYKCPACESTSVEWKIEKTKYDLHLIREELGQE